MDDIVSWVAASKDPRDRAFREAIHALITAFAKSARLQPQTYMKGGILLAIRYQSSRYTTDIDFSNPALYVKGLEAQIIDALSAELPTAINALGYDLDCRVQSFDVQPRRIDASFVTVKITVGYARPGTREHARLVAKQCPTTIGIDYSFNEGIHDVDIVSTDNNGKLQAYGLVTQLAEKYRAMLQQVTRDRVRRQDAYDLDYLITRVGSFDNDLRIRLLEAIKAKRD